MKLKILSWNIWGGRHIEDVLAFLKDADADIIALQEVIKEKDTNTALTIAERLKYEPVYAIGMPISSKWTGPIREKEETLMFGNAILSKHPITFSKHYELSSGESRIVISADISINGSIVHVFSVHLKHLHITQNKPEIVAMHDGQADQLAKFLPPSRTVVMGDFNALPGSYAIKKMSSVVRDAEVDSATPTWSVYPEGCDVCSPKGIAYKLDYIFTSKDIITSSFKVEQSDGSDHLPVSAIVEL